MAPKVTVNKDKKSRKTINIQLKQEIIEKHERGVKISALVSEYGLAQSTISTIIQKKDKFKAIKVKDASTRIFKDGYKLQHNNHQALVLESLADDEAFMDLTLTFQGRAVKAHKSVLSVMSPYFRRVLSDNPCQHPIIVMPRDIQFDELENLLTYIYKGEVTVPFQEVSSLLKTAQMLEIKGLNEIDNESAQKDHDFFKGTENVFRGPPVTSKRIMQETEASTSTPSKTQEKTDDFEFTAVKEELLSDCEEPPQDDHSTTIAKLCMPSRPRKTFSRSEERGSKRPRILPNSSWSSSPHSPRCVMDDVSSFEGRTVFGTKDIIAISDHSPEKKPFGCLFCAWSHQSVESLRCHLSLEHQLYDPFICDCGAIFFQRSLLDIHKIECCNRRTAKSWN